MTGSPLAPLLAAGPLGIAFLAAAAASLGLLLFELLFTSFARRLNSHAFLEQVEKLVLAGNVERALKLTSVMPSVPLCAIVHAGLREALPGSPQEGSAAPSERAQRAMGALQGVIYSAALGRVRRALGVALLPCALGVAFLAIHHVGQAAIAGALALEALLCFAVSRLPKRLARDLHEATGTVVNAVRTALDRKAS